MAKKMDWYKSCSYDDAQKRSFHSTAMARLRKLADELGLEKDSYDLRSNKAGPAVSGEITLHHENVYVQVSQPATRSNTGILIRTCKGRRDYTGGPNNFAPLSALDDIEDLASKVKRVAPILAGPDPDPSEGPAIGMRW